MRLGTRLRRVEHDRFDEMVRCPRGEIGTRTRKRTITSVKPIVVRHEPRVQPRVYTCSRCAGQDPQSSSCGLGQVGERSEKHTSELQSLMRISYAVFCLKKKQKHKLH